MQVAIVGETVEIAASGEVLRTHPVRHDRSREHRAFANAAQDPATQDLGRRGGENHRFIPCDATGHHLGFETHERDGSVDGQHSCQFVVVAVQRHGAGPVGDVDDGDVVAGGAARELDAVAILIGPKVRDGGA